MTTRYAWDKDIPNTKPDRTDWIWRETLRRYVVMTLTQEYAFASIVYYADAHNNRVISLLSVIDLLLEGIMSASTTFRHEFSDVPLPATRSLWNARTNRRWRVAYDQYCSTTKLCRPLLVSDLIESDEAG